MATLHQVRSAPTGQSVASCNRLVLKLSGPADLSEDDRRAVDDLCGRVRPIKARHDIIREGDSPKYVHVMMEGWAARYKVVHDGSRQITAFLLPGDFCDMHVAILGEMDHSIIALTDAQVALVPHEIMEELPRRRPELGRALWWATLVDEAVLRDWIVNIGRRDAEKRIAHLFCELHARLELVGLVEDDQFDLPLTQEVIADALGLTPVHVNRMLQNLRGEGMIALERGELSILDITGLRKFAGFDPNYLHRGKLAIPN